MYIIIILLYTQCISKAITNKNPLGILNKLQFFSHHQTFVVKKSKKKTPAEDYDTGWQVGKEKEGKWSGLSFFYAFVSTYQ